MLSCEQFEILLADHIDGELSSPARAGDRAAFEQHLGSCAVCAALAEDAQSAVSFMDLAADVEPPPALMTKILHATNSGWEFKLRARGIRGAINRFLAPVLQPRFVMGAMMTLMSVTMLTRCAGGTKTNLTASDLDPVKLWTSLDDRTHRLWDRTMKSYESMRLVYEIRNQINDWKQQQTEAEEAAAEAQVNSKKLETPKQK
ncbi:MAG: hypothetical protein QOJ99_3373 [Bryobacterales bacterium]|jgi:hypothetical protein|nr:hypothetical protein [Bryobacterales bacterium]